jgi:hypothetical protein
MNYRELIPQHLSRTERIGIDKVIIYLEGSDFYTAPASANHHSNVEGGLALHSWTVFQLLCEKNERFNLSMPNDTLIICGLLHDFCKINTYKRTIKNVKKGTKKDYKGKDVANWVEEEVWTSEDQFPVGHGEKSVMLLQEFIKLCQVEIMMIRWHMGGYEPKDNYWTMNRARELFPMITVMSTADLEASHILEKVTK